MKNKKLFFLAAFLFFALILPFQVLASAADCTDDCDLDSDCAYGDCRPANCTRNPAQTVSVCATAATTTTTTSTTTAGTVGSGGTCSNGSDCQSGLECTTCRGTSGDCNNPSVCLAPVSITSGEGGSCTTDSDCESGLNCYLKAECKDGSCMDSICSTTTPTGTDYCSGGDCTLSVCTTERPFITGGICGDSTKKCCQTESTSSTGDNCSGTCRTECENGTEVRSSNVSEYCRTDGQFCCVSTNSTTTNVNGNNSNKKSGTAWNVQSAGEFGLPSGSISGIVQGTVAWILGIFGFLGIITFVVAGIYYFIAAGDAEMEKKAKNAMKMGIIGIVVGLIGYVVIKAVDLMLNAGNSF